MKKSWLIILLVLPLTCLANSERLNYQGKLAQGNSPVTATVPMTFQIFDGKNGTNVLYEESMDVEVVDGFYSVELGENPNLGQLISAIKREDAHMQVVVDGNPLKPREKVGKPPFAERSSEMWYAFCHWNHTKDNFEDAIANTNVWAHLSSTTAIKKGSILADEDSISLIAFPAVPVKKHVEKIRIRIHNTHSSQFENQNVGFMQVVVRSLSDDQVIRTLSDQLSTVGVPTKTWFEWPLNTPLQQAIVDEGEYLCLEFSAPDDDDGLSQSTGFMWERVFINVYVK